MGTELITELFRAFNRFVLHDVLAKILPGGILLAGLLVSVSTDLPKDGVGDLIRKILANPPYWVMCLLIGSTWVLGFAVQEIGSWCFLLTTESTVFPAVLESQKAKVNEAVDRLLKQCKCEERQAALVERHIVIKEASGNTAVAIMIAAVVVMSSNFATIGTVLSNLDAWYGRMLSLTGLIVVALLARHHRNRIIQHCMVRKINEGITSSFSMVADRSNAKEAEPKV